MRWNLTPEKKLFLTNFINYGIFQASKYVVPLITVPFIIHVIGVEKFGIVSLAQGLANYLRVGVDYGWNILGVQYIARSQHHADERDRIVNTILVQQLLLSGIAFLILLALIGIFPKLQTHWGVFIAAFGLVPANMLMVPWFFVGMQKVRYLNRAFLFSRLLYVVLIVLFLKPLEHMIWVPVFNSLSLFIGGAIVLVTLRKRFAVQFFLPRWQQLKQFFREGWPIFLSYFSTNFYRNSQVLILALFVNDYFLGIYSAAEKIIKVIQGTFMPLSQTIYPILARKYVESRNRAFVALKKAIWVLGSLAFVVSIGVIVTAPLLIKVIVGQNNADGVKLLWIGSGVIFFGVLNYILGVLFLTNFGYKVLFSRAVFITGIWGILSCFVLSYFFQAFGAMGSFTLAEIFLFIMLSVFSIQKKRVLLSEK